jgi:hypothetical protein
MLELVFIGTKGLEIIEEVKPRKEDIIIRKDRNYKLILVSDCCGATSYVKEYTHEEVHRFTLEELKERTYETKFVKLNSLFRSIEKDVR